MKYTHNYMKIFLDTADTEIINEHFKTGLIDGVTTNPTLIMKSGRNPEEVYQEIKDIGITELVTTVCHEMVHIKQYARNEMTDECVQFGAATWKGRKVSPKVSYYDLPWEKEAYRLQDSLALMVWKSGEI